MVPSAAQTEVTGGAAGPMASSKQIGRYQVERPLGTGSFATVWLAYDPGLDGHVALKILADNWSLDEDIKRRFLQEARILWRAQHDRIVRVHLVDESDGRPFFVMDYADGGTLYERVKARQQRESAYTVVEAVAMAREIAECLTVAHDLGIVHRDLKPSNILFQSLPGGRSARAAAPSERVMLADFGLARRLGSAAAGTVLAGTPAYMAPEQGDPARAGQADERADVYAANAILYELLAGTPPFADQTLDSVRQRGRADALVPLAAVREDVPQALSDVVQRGLAFEPADRFASALEWADALTAALSPGSLLEAPAHVDGDKGPTRHVEQANRRLLAHLSPSPLAGAVQQAEAALSGAVRLALVGTAETVVDDLADRLTTRAGVEIERLLMLDGPTLPPNTADAVIMMLPREPELAVDYARALEKSLSKSRGAGPIVAVGVVLQQEDEPDAAAPLRADRRVTETLATVLPLASPLQDAPTGRSPLRSELGAIGAAGTTGWLPALSLGEVWQVLDRFVLSRRRLLQADVAVAVLRRALSTHAADPAVEAVRDAVERLELAIPELAELAVLRSILAGGVLLSDTARDEARRMLLDPDRDRRLGLPPGASGAERSQAALAGAERWRRIAERLPYSSQEPALVLARTFERMWEEGGLEKANL